jgi:hypothetical protein
MKIYNLKGGPVFGGLTALRKPKWSLELMSRVMGLRREYPRWGKEKLCILLRERGIGGAEHKGKGMYIRVDDKPMTKQLALAYEPVYRYPDP